MRTPPHSDAPPRTNVHPNYSSCETFDKFMIFLLKCLNLLAGSGFVKKSASLSRVLINGTTISWASTISHVEVSPSNVCLERS